MTIVMLLLIVGNAHSNDYLADVSSKLIMVNASFQQSNEYALKF